MTHPVTVMAFLEDTRIDRASVYLSQDRRLRRRISERGQCALHADLSNN